MTGEMVEVDLDEYPFHAEIAEELNGEVKPFDKYQGPYVLVGTGSRLWVVHDGDGPPCIYREDAEVQSARFMPYLNGEPNLEEAVRQARSLFTDEELDTIEEI